MAYAPPILMPAFENHAIHTADPRVIVELDPDALGFLVAPEPCGEVWATRNAKTGAHLRVWAAWASEPDAMEWVSEPGYIPCLAAWTDGPALPGSGRHLFESVVMSSGGKIIQRD